MLRFLLGQTLSLACRQGRGLHFLAQTQRVKVSAQATFLLLMATAMQFL